MSTPTAAGILQAGINHMQDRAATYDKPAGERSMAATVDAFRAFTGISLTEEQGWLFMICLKGVRSQQGAFRADSYEDGAAYFGLMGEAAFESRAPLPEFDEARVDRVASSHGDGEHYAEVMTAEEEELPAISLEELAIQQGGKPIPISDLPDGLTWDKAPDWATVLLESKGIRKTKVWASSHEYGARAMFCAVNGVVEYAIHPEAYRFIANRPEASV